MEATESLWMTETRKGSYPRFQDQGRRWDVAVIGGGITGVTCAWMLKRAGKSVALFEADEIASGVTGRTTAHLTEVLDTRFHQLISYFGEDAAVTSHPWPSWYFVETSESGQREETRHILRRNLPLAL